LALALAPTLTVTPTPTPTRTLTPTLTLISLRRLKRCADARERREHVALDELGADADEANVVEPLELRLPRGVSRLPLGRVMHASVDLDDEPMARREKVDDESSKHRLPPKPRPELAAAKLRPEQRFVASDKI